MPNSKQQDDPFDTLLNLEDTFYNDGYELGVTDGKRAGLIEGRLFGLEKGFEKYATMGHLYGRAVVWSRRLSSSQIKKRVEIDHKTTLSRSNNSESKDRKSESDALHQEPIENKLEQTILPTLPENIRLEKHIRTLYALAEASSLSTENTEEAVADFEDRLKRAEGKIKIIEKLTGEANLAEIAHNGSTPLSKSQKISGDGSIEDTSSLYTRH